MTPPEFKHHEPHYEVGHAPSHGCCGAEEHHEGEWFFRAEFLYLKARRNDLQYALPDQNNNTVPEGRIESVQFDPRAGFRVAGGYNFANSPYDIAGVFMYAHQIGGNSAAAPPGGVVFPATTRPGVINRASVASADTSLNYRLYDVEIARRFELAHHGQLRLFVGPRIADIDTRFNVFYDGLNAMMAFTRQDYSFNGAGLVAGGEGNFDVGYGFSLYGRAKGGLIYGDIRSKATETNNNNLTVLTNVRDQFDQMVPVVELAAGVNWKFRNVFIGAGYEVTSWINFFDNPVFVDDFASGKFNYRQSDLTLEGFYLRGGVTF
jgi:hypothetical protein